MRSLMGIAYLKEDILIRLRLHASILQFDFLSLNLLIYDLNDHFWEKISLSLDLESSEMYGTFFMISNNIWVMEWMHLWLYSTQ